MNDSNQESLIVTRIDEGILTLTINRPKQLNALNSAVIFELSKEINAAEKNSDVQVIVLTGSGEKAFVAGADIVEFAEFSPEEGKKLASLGQTMLFNKIETAFSISSMLKFSIPSRIRLLPCGCMLSSFEDMVEGLTPKFY